MVSRGFRRDSKVLQTYMGCTHVLLEEGHVVGLGDSPLFFLSADPFYPTLPEEYKRGKREPERSREDYIRLTWIYMLDDRMRSCSTGAAPYSTQLRVGSGRQI